MTPSTSAEAQELLCAYQASMERAGMFAGPPTVSVARMFFARVGPGGWDGLSLAEQCAQPHKNRRVIGWLMVTGRLAASADYLVAARLNVGDMAGRHHPEFFSRFCATATELGFGAKAVQLQWSTLVKIAVIHGVLPDRVTPLSFKVAATHS